MAGAAFCFRAHSLIYELSAQNNTKYCNSKMASKYLSNYVGLVRCAMLGLIVYICLHLQELFKQ